MGSRVLGGVTGAEAAAHISALLGPCRHLDVEPVILSTGEIVAQVCVTCLAALPVSWGCDDCDYVEVMHLVSPWPARMMGMPCERHCVREVRP